MYVHVRKGLCPMRASVDTRVTCKEACVCVCVHMYISAHVHVCTHARAVCAQSFRGGIHMDACACQRNSVFMRAGMCPHTCTCMHLQEYVHPIRLYDFASMCMCMLICECFWICVHVCVHVSVLYRTRAALCAPASIRGGYF